MLVVSLPHRNACVGLIKIKGHGVSTKEVMQAMEATYSRKKCLILLNFCYAHWSFCKIEVNNTVFSKNGT